MKYLLLIFIGYVGAGEIIAPCATISVNQNTGIFSGMGSTNPSTGSITIVSTRPYDSSSIDSNSFSKGINGKSNNPLNAIIYRGPGTSCLDRNLSIQDTLFSWSQINLSIDRIQRLDSLLADTMYTSHRKYLCFDFSREQKISQASNGTIRGRLEGQTTIAVCQCLKDGVPCVW